MPEIKRTWSFPTSPRSSYKLPQTLLLFAEFEGRVWNREAQREFAQKLAKSDFYEGVIPANLDFAARDRINRAPTTFGFVELKPTIKVTDAGRRLIEGVGLEELFTRQLIKWQYPSPKYRAKKYSNFNIKPFLEVLRLAYEVDGLSKKEIAIFCLPFVDFRKYEEVKTALLNFRNHLVRLTGPEKKRYIIQTHFEYYKSIYHEEIAHGSFQIREQNGRRITVEHFIKTKVRNSMDYADAAIRYFRATGLFKLSATTFRLKIVESKREIVKAILDTNNRVPTVFREDERSFLNMLGNPNLPVLPDDLPETLKVEISNLVDLIATRRILPKNKIDQYREEVRVSTDIYQLKNTRPKLEDLLEMYAKQIQINELQSYLLFDDVMKMYDKIVLRSDYDIPDKPLFFEWNTWRAFAMLDDGEIICNAILDKEGKPLSTAPGGNADNVCYYDDFALVVEVTLTRGERQFEAEHESVPRHLGKLVKRMRENADTRPVFGLFIASGLNPSTIANFYSLRRMEVSHYGGKARIIPLELNDFKQMLIVAKKAGGIKSFHIQQFLQWADQQADIVTNENE